MIRSGLVRRTPLAKVSKRRRMLLADWELTKRAVYDRDRSCQGSVLGLAGECWGGLHVHHIRSRSRFPALICDPSNCCLLCAGHHRWAHEHPRIAKRLGVIL